MPRKRGGSMPMSKRGARSDFGAISRVDAEALRSEIEAQCQLLVDAGIAFWRINDNGDAELQMVSGEAYLLGEAGVTRCR
ncbi:hypothetical protein NUV25_00045 [Burkholderia pseudomultivorans]|uniref:hypothetical protein n=1 Tax=Burkholderia pseudomultivorans TaxID=1207504 RepID=UPI002876AD51|nr:hypothetical protein [Burkholderia pseudomultivorans]MDS0856083.1 hypothetical protein [Burkholderia pseudomultivorans]